MHTHTRVAEIPAGTLFGVTPAVTRSTPGGHRATPAGPRITRAPNTTPTTPDTDGLVDQLLARMTLAEKIGQLFMVHFDEPYLSPTLERQIKEMHIGGVILFSSNIESPSQVASLINEAQGLAIESGPGIPLFVAVDQEGWPISRLDDGFTVFPSNMAIGATGSTTNAMEVARITAQELGYVGVNMNLAPVLDVNSNPANPVIGLRSFGADPERVAELGVAMIRTYQANGIIATGKHFPGHGNTSLDSHFALPTDIHNLDELRQAELLPFQRAVAGDVSAMMTAHVFYPALDNRAGIPATLSSPILEDLLRREMGYTGLVATDSLGMGALDQQYGILRASQMAFAAGADLLMYGNDPGHDPLEARGVYDFLLSQVEQGNIPEARVNASVRRILGAKVRYGILVWEPVDVEEIPSFVGTPENLAKAREIARDSITLVKNWDQLLPLSKGISLAVVSPEGALAARGIPEEYASNIMEVAISLDPSPTEVAQIVQNLSTGDVDVVILGTINAINNPGQVRLATALADYPLVVVALGLPYDLAALPDVGTYLATYGFSPPALDVLPELLFGQTQPAGRLPVPISPEYPIGFGITTW